MTRAFHVVHTPRVRHACSEGPAPVRDRPSARRAPERLQTALPPSRAAPCPLILPKPRVCVCVLCVPRVLSAQAGESHPLSSVRAPHRTRDLLAQRTTCRAALLPPASLQTGVGAPPTPPDGRAASLPGPAEAGLVPTRVAVSLCVFYSQPGFISITCQSQRKEAKPKKPHVCRCLWRGRRGGRLPAAG